MKVICLKDYISENDMDFIEEEQLHLRACKVYVVEHRQTDIITMPKYNILIRKKGFLDYESPDSYTVLTEKEFTKYFRIIEE